MPRVYFTGRKKIAKSSVSIVYRSGKTPSFEASLDLSSHTRTLPRTAKVVVEAYHTTMLQRFDFGTVADCRARVPLRLSNFDEFDRPRFRVLIVDADKDPGVLLAACDSVGAIDPELGPDGGRSMLPLFPQPNSKMRGELWKVALTGGSYQIWYNKDIAQFASKLKSKHPETLGMLLPAALREILSRVHLWECVSAEPTEWTVLAQQISGEPFPASFEGDNLSVDEVEGWINNVVAAFCQRKGRFFDQIILLENNDENSKPK